MTYICSESIYAEKTRTLHVGTNVRFTEHRGSWNRCSCETGVITHKNKFESFCARFTRENCEHGEYEVRCGCHVKNCVMPYEIEKGD